MNSWINFVVLSKAGYKWFDIPLVHNFLMVPVVLSEKDTFDNNSTYNFENYEKFKLHHFGVLPLSPLRYDLYYI